MTWDAGLTNSIHEPLGPRRGDRGEVVTSKCLEILGEDRYELFMFTSIFSFCLYLYIYTYMFIVYILYFLYMFIHVYYVSLYLCTYIYVYHAFIKKIWRHGIMGNGPTKNGTGDPKAHGPLSDIGWCTTAFIRYNYSTWYNCHPPKQQLDPENSQCWVESRKAAFQSPRNGRVVKLGHGNQLTQLIWRFPEMGVPLNHPFDFRIFDCKPRHKLGIPKFMACRPGSSIAARPNRLIRQLLELLHIELDSSRDGLHP